MDVNWAVLLGICALFALFTIGMFLSSAQMTLRNLTTIENLNHRAAVYYIAVRSQSQQQGHGMHSLGPYKYTVSKTNQGDNPWDLGPYRNWCSVMGRHWTDWFL